MNDKEIIEEMAKDIKSSLILHINKTILYPYLATDLYKAGYRKVPEGAVVLLREDYNRIRSKERLVIDLESIKKAEDKTRKETAEKIFNSLNHKFREIYKQLGVEMKEQDNER